METEEFCEIWTFMSAEDSRAALEEQHCVQSHAQLNCRVEKSIQTLAEANKGAYGGVEEPRI